VLGDPDTARSQHERRGNVERADRSPPVPQVSNILVSLRHLHRACTHRPRKTDNLDGRSPFMAGRSADRQFAMPRRGLHDLGHRGRRFVARQISCRVSFSISAKHDPPTG
jgi:hypothetical protein